MVVVVVVVVVVAVVVVIYLSIYLSIYLFICKLENEAILPQFLNLTTSKRSNSANFVNFRSWQQQKRSHSARLPSNIESWVQSWRPRPNAFCDFATKRHAKSYEVLHLSRKIISANLKIWCSKMQPLSGYQRPDLRTSLMNMYLVLCLPRGISSFQIHVPRLPSF